MKHRHAEGGYTLAEALVVVAIIGLVTMVSIPQFVTLYRTNQLRVAIRQFAADIRSARQLAIMTGQPVKVTFTTSTTSRSYAIYEKDDDGDWKTEAKKSGTLPENTYLASTTFEDIGDDEDSDAPDDADSRPDIVFLPKGSVWNVTTTTANVVVKSSWDTVSKDTFTLSIKPSGNIKID
jgi:type II secretion system protein H